MADVPGWEVENKLARQHGWQPVLDPKRGYGWCLFKKDIEAVWYSGQWVRAMIMRDEDGFEWFAEHRKFDTLEEALTA